MRLVTPLLVITACLAQPLAGQAIDSLASARRVIAAASLAAKEYALGVVPAGGQINEVRFRGVETTKVRVVFAHQGKARSGVSEVLAWPE